MKSTKNITNEFDIGAELLRYKNLYINNKKDLLKISDWATGLNKEFQEKNQELQEKNQELQEKDQELQEKNQELQEKNQELQQNDQELGEKAKELLRVQKIQIINDLQLLIENNNKKNTLVRKTSHVTFLKTENIQIEENHLVAITSDPQVELKLFQPTKYLKVVFQVSKENSDSMVELYYKSEEEDYSEQHSSKYHTDKNGFVVFYIKHPSAITYLRLDPTNRREKFTINYLEVISISKFEYRFLSKDKFYEKKKKLSKIEMNLSSEPINISSFQKDKLIYIFPVIDWNFRIQRPQQIAKEFAKEGYTIIYFTTTFSFAEVPKYLINTIDNNIFNITLTLNEEKNMYINELTEENISFLIQSILLFEKEQLVNQRDIIIDHPFWMPLADKLSGNFNIYDCMDYHPGFGDESEHLVKLEEMSMTKSDLLLLSSADLYNRFSQKNKNVALVRNGCEYKYFSTAPKEKYKSNFKKIIGYYGAISSWFDTELLLEISKRFKEYEFLLIGATHGCENLDILEEVSNITFIGEVPYDKLTYYLYSFDIAIMPFKVNELTLATNPVKVYEYLSSGVPVISTKLPEIELMGSVVYGASNINEFIDAIDSTLENNSNTLVAERKKFAKNNDWYSRYNKIKSQIKISKNIKPKVSIIIVTYNNLDFTKDCLESMKQFNNYNNIEIIIVDNLSTDGSREFLSKYALENDVNVILHNENSGFSAGNNIGIEASSGDIIILLNNDTLVTPNWIENLIKHFDTDETIGMVGPRTNNIGNESRINVDYTNNKDMIDFSYDIYYNNIGKQYNINILAFFCVAIKREVINKVGLLDEIFGIGMFEDDDYCIRTKNAGYKLICADDVFIHHHLGASFDKDLEWKEKLFNKNRAIFEKRYGKWVLHEYR